MGTVEKVLDQIADESPAAFDMLAEKIVKRLSASVIPSALPAWAGDWIREVAKHGSYVWSYTIPMGAGTCMGVFSRLNPDGSLHMEFHDTNGCPFWRGTFRPEVSNAHS